MNKFSLFDFEYTFDDKKTANEIEQAVINHYFFDEIGQETPDAFKHVFMTRFKRIIGYYNKLHNTTLLAYDPLTNYKMTENLERLANTENNQTMNVDNTENTSQSTGNTHNEFNFESGQDTSDKKVEDTQESSATTTGDTLDSDYPQSPIDRDFSSEKQERNSTTDTSLTSVSNTFNKDLHDLNSRTEGRQATDTNGNLKGSQKTKGSTEDKQTETYEKAIEGVTGRTYQELVQLERQNILRITQMIIKELSPCFMLTY